MSPPTARRILVLHPADEGYGADRILLVAAEGLVARGWEMCVVLPDDVTRGWLTEQLESLGIKVRRGPLAPARRRYLTLLRLPAYLLALLRARRFVRAVAAEERPTVIHVNTTALLVAAILGRPVRARLVWHVHEIVVRPRLLATMFRVAPVATADRVIAVSDAVRRWLQRIPLHRDRVVRIHNGIAGRPAAIRGTPRPLRVAYVGRLNRWKGYEVFVDAVSRIAPRFPDATFVVAGDAPTGEEWRSADLARRVAAAGLVERVELLGYSADVPALLDTVDVVAVPSTWPDPLPTVVLEAMRSGCAVVASAHGGAPEMIEDGVSGILVPPGDAAELADAIASLLSDDHRRSAIGARASERVATEFSVDRFIDQLEGLYSDVLR